MDTSSVQPRVLMPEFAMKRQRLGANGFGAGWSAGARWTNEQAHFGTLDPNEDVVIVKELSSIVFFERRGWCYGQLHPIPFSRRTKGAISVSETSVPTAAELRATCAIQYEADLRAKKEQEIRLAELRAKKEQEQEAHRAEQAPATSVEAPKEPIPEEPPECLKLSLYEALYLSNDLQKLTILMGSGSEDAFSPDDFFDYCCGTLGGIEFATRYVAYRYYRQKGWVVRNGESFGVNFVLYKSHPADYHSTYGILVVSPLSPKPCNWRKMGGLCRELCVVSKGLIICTVSTDHDTVSDLALSDLDRFRVSEMHVKAWFARRQFQSRGDVEVADSQNDDG